MLTANRKRRFVVPDDALGGSFLCYKPPPRCRRNKMFNRIRLPVHRALQLLAPTEQSLAMTRSKPDFSKRGAATRRNHKPRSDDRNGSQPQQESAPPPQPQSTFSTPGASTPSIAETIDVNAMRFEDLTMLDPVLKQTITQDLGLERMTQIQEATVQDLLLNRVDCLAQAKTGTGKTIAFLLPAIQSLMRRQHASGISLLVISPTRELAMQIAKEATLLLQRMKQYRVCFAIGGTNKDREERDILKVWW